MEDKCFKGKNGRVRRPFCLTVKQQTESKPCSRIRSVHDEITKDSFE